MLRYPVRFTPADQGVILTFPDIPEAKVEAACEEDALAGALSELECRLSGYLAQQKPIPTPSDICGAPTVETSKFSLAKTRLQSPSGS